MGSSASANLFYGYVFDQEGVFPWENENDDYEISESRRDRNWEVEHYWLHIVLGKSEEEIDSMEYKVRRDLTKNIAVEVCSWGALYDGSSCYYIRPKDKKADICVSWDTPTVIKPSEMPVNSEWDTVLKKFARDIMIDLKGQTPAWHLVASYG